MAEEHNCFIPLLTCSKLRYRVHVLKTDPSPIFHNINQA